MEKLIEYYNELTNNDFNEEELKIELDSLNALKKICKWLVDKDKIDLWKIKKLYRKSNEHSIHTYPVMHEYSDLESLLMYLAIQDSQIEFLVSVLK